MAERLQNLDVDVAVDCVVVDNEDLPALGRGAGLRRRRGFTRGFGAAGGREGEADRRALSSAALDFDIAAQAPDDPANNAHAEPLPVSLRREEAFEQARLDLFAHPGARI